MCNNIVRIVELDVRSFGTSVPITKSHHQNALFQLQNVHCYFSHKSLRKHSERIEGK